MYILNTIGRILNLNKIGLINDDGLIHVPNSNGPKTSRLQSKIIRAFRIIGLGREISSNLKK